MKQWRYRSQPQAWRAENISVLTVMTNLRRGTYVRYRRHATCDRRRLAYIGSMFIHHLVRGLIMVRADRRDAHQSPQLASHHITSPPLPSSSSSSTSTQRPETNCSCLGTSVSACRFYAVMLFLKNLVLTVRPRTWTRT